MGTVIISVDATLGWGFHAQPAPPTERIERARWGWKRLAALFEAHEVPATWGVVGHLLLDGCDGRHEDHPAGPQWFERERDEWRERPEFRFAADLVDRLERADVDHDIGFNTFSNIDFGAETTTRQLAAAELERCRRLSEQHRLSSLSFTFPGNSVGHRGLLATHGFRCYRGGPSLDGSTLRKLADATVLSGRSRLVEPTFDEYGLVRIPPSLHLFGFEGLKRRLFRPLVGDPVVKAAKNGIGAATRREGVFHMWLRPNEVTDERDAERVETVLEHLAERRDQLEIGTMADVAGSVQQTRQAPVKP